MSVSWKRPFSKPLGKEKPISPSVPHPDPNAGKSGRGRSLFSYCSFHFLDDGFTDSVYLLLPFIAAELHLSFSEVGLLKGCFSGAMSLLQFPMSLLAEIAGEPLVIAAGSFGLTGGFLILSMAYTFPTILLALILAKGTNAGQHGLGSSLISRAFEAPGRRTAMGTYNFSGDVGKVCWPFLVALMIPAWGWRRAVFLLAVSGLLFAVILSIFAGRRSAPVLSPAVSRKPQPAGGRWGISDIRTFIALLTIGIIDISVRNVLLTFLPFLLLERGVDSSRVGFALTLLFIGGATGKFACGVLAERWGIVPMVIGTEFLTAAGIAGLFFSPLPLAWILLPFVGIVLNGTSSVLYATVAEIISPAGRSRGYGLYYAITLGSGALSPLAFGVITDSLGLSFTILAIAAVALATIPLSRFLSPKSQSA